MHIILNRIPKDKSYVLNRLICVITCKYSNNLNLLILFKFMCLWSLSCPCQSELCWGDTDMAWWVWLLPHQGWMNQAVFSVQTKLNPFWSCYWQLSHWKQVKKALADCCLASCISNEYVQSRFCLLYLFVAKDIVITFECMSYICDKLYTYTQECE